MKQTNLIITTLVIFQIISFNAICQNNKVLTFEEALKISYENNHAVKQAKAAIEEKEQFAKSRKALYMPTIGVSANYVCLSEELHLDLTPVKEAILPLYETQSKYGVYSGVPTGVEAMPYLNQDMSTAAVREKLEQGRLQLENSNWNQVIQEKQFGMVDANFQWVLFSGGKIMAANKAARLQVEEENSKFAQKQDEVFNELVQRYFGLSLANNATAIRNDVLEAMNKHVWDAERMEKEGFVAHADVLHVKMYQAEAKREFMKAQKTEEFLNVALKNTLAIDSVDNILAASNLFIVDSLENVEHYKSIAYTNNPSLAQLKIKHDLTIQNYNVERADLFPSVAVMGMYDLANVDLSPMVPEWMVGVGLSWTIFNGGARYHKIKSAKLKTLQVEEISADVSSDIATVVEKLHNSLIINQEQLTELNIAEEFATEYVRVRQKAFDEQMINSTELVDARLALAKVKIAKLQVMYEYDIALAQLLYYCGKTDLFIDYMSNQSVINN